MTSKDFKEIMENMPTFGRYKEKIRGLYNIINCEASKNFPIFSKNNKKKVLNTDTASPRIKKSVFSSQEETACEKILEIFKDCLENNIVKKLPSNPIFIDSHKKVMIFLN